MSKRTNQKTEIEKNRPVGLPPLPKVSQIALLVDDKNYSQVDLYAQLIIRALPQDPYANLALAWVANKFGLDEYQKYYLKVVEQAVRFFSTTIEVIATDLRIDLSFLSANRCETKAGDLTLNNEGHNYHIAKAWGFGFGSEMSALMGQAYLAEICGRELVVHWGSNFLYRPEPGKECVFDCYFERFNDLKIDKVIEDAKNIYPPKWTKETIGGVVNIQPWANKSMNNSINENCTLRTLNTDDAYRYLAKKYLVPKKDIQDEVDVFVNEYLEKPFVAVHARGSDKDEGYHTALLDVYKSEFGDRLVLTDCQRCDTEVGVHYDESTNKLQAGREMLIDMLVAARASCFIGLGLSNPSQLITYFGSFSDGNYILFGENRLKQFNTHLYKTVSVT